MLTTDAERHHYFLLLSREQSAFEGMQSARHDTELWQILSGEYVAAVKAREEFENTGSLLYWAEMRSEVRGKVAMYA